MERQREAPQRWGLETDATGVLSPSSRTGSSEVRSKPRGHRWGPQAAPRPGGEGPEPLRRAGRAHR